VNVESETKLILIVDDELDMRIFMTTLFETNGFKAVAVRDGSQGVARARSLNPGLILLDVMMPGEGGAAMYKTLKSDPSLARIPVVMLSAVDENAFRHYLTMLNARLKTPVPAPDGYVAKPPDPERLLALVKSLII